MKIGDPASIYPDSDPGRLVHSGRVEVSLIVIKSATRSLH